MEEDDEQLDRDGWQEGEWAFAWELRVMVVSAVWMLPGVLFGALARLCVSDCGSALWWLLGGGILGAVAGGLLEADHWP